MRLARFKSLGFFFWHGRHEFYHVLLGLVWAWYLRERWNEFNPRWIWLAMLGSVLPDLDHIIYFFTYGRWDSYNIKLRYLIKSHQWRASWLYMKNGHKKNTSLMTHNVYFMIILLGVAVVASFYAWRVGVILFGAMFSHYLFDILDDLVILGHLNPNWKHWGSSWKTKDRSTL